MSWNQRAVEAKKQRDQWEALTERKLRDNFDVYSKETSASPEGLLEAQRSGNERTATTEAQLEKVREGTKHAVTEKRLDTEKGMFTEHRHQVQEGQVPALEAKRLAGKPVEKEKYKPANER